MKKLVFSLAALLTVGCTEQSLMNDFIDETASIENLHEVSTTNLVNSYIEKARWGDASAYIKLAECYHDGIGVKADFFGTLSMLMMADQFGGTKSVQSYLDSLPDTDNMKLTFNAIGQLDKYGYDQADSIANILIGNGYSEGYSLRGILQIERGDTIGGQQTIQAGADNGSTFAELLMCAVPTPGEHSDNIFEAERIKGLSGRVPIADLMLGDIYSGYESDSTIDINLAAMYYRRADEQGFLGKRQARWLLNYYNNGGISVDAKEIERLNIVIEAFEKRYIPETARDVEITDSVCTDSMRVMD